MKLETFDVTRQAKAIWLDGFGLKWPMYRDRHPEISQNLARFSKIWCLGGVKSGSLQFLKAWEGLGSIWVDSY